MDRSAQHLLPAAIVGADRLFVFGIFCHQQVRSLLQAPSGILLLVPVRGTDRRKKPSPLLFVGDDLVIEIFRVPVDEHAAQVEDKGIYLHTYHFIFCSRSAAFSSVSAFFAKQKRTTRSSFPDW